MCTMRSSCSDLIVAIGHDTVEKPPFLMRDEGGPKVLHIGFTSATVEQVFHPDAEVVGDIGSSLTAAGRTASTAGSKPMARSQTWRQEILGHINERAERTIASP